MCCISSNTKTRVLSACMTRDLEAQNKISNLMVLQTCGPPKYSYLSGCYSDNDNLIYF